MWMTETLAPRATENVTVIFKDHRITATVRTACATASIDMDNRGLARNSKYEKRPEEC